MTLANSTPNMMHSLSPVVVGRALMILGSFGDATAGSSIYVLLNGYESVLQKDAGKPNSAQFSADEILVIGMVCTQANDNIGTDSDASTTALYCAQVLNCNPEIKFAAQQIGCTHFLSRTLIRFSAANAGNIPKDGGKPTDHVQWRRGERTRAYSVVFSGSVGGSQMVYELDRDENKEPSLDMTRAALA
ncbi:hypothetical protein BB8028_0003g02460 [Beauveria bassiana]|uniref:Uncharacterized protein n=1 Tax=Beauveria bassiana TaxID=176275 RepID=A0A2S7Y6Z7_BEABA|nr:hypothetical protein BB8028_0003g02460 [Beauveria bassiana]